MTLAVLLQTSRVSAEATVERLQGLAIDAQVLDQPNLFAKIASAGNYRVRVAVPEEELGRARAELARWEGEARPRVRALAREVQRGLLLGSLPALVFVAVLALLRADDMGLWLAVVPLWFVGLWAWARWDQGRAAKAEAEALRKEDGAAAAPPET